jgi:hypothetical protein
LPAYFTSGSKALVLEAQVPRTAAATLYVRALERALFRELRQNRGLSYTAATAYVTDGRARATVRAIADAQPNELDSVLDCFLYELRKLRDVEVDHEEMEAIRALALEAVGHTDVESGLLARRATDLLCGRALRTTAELAERLRAATVADVREIGRRVMETALLMVPEAGVRQPAGFEAAPVFSRYAVTGKRYRCRADPNVAIVHGVDGVSRVMPPGPATVLFDQCVAMLRWPDGARQLVGVDGMAVRIEPTWYTVPASAMAAMDDAVSPDVVVDLPSRNPDSVPRTSRIAYLRARLRTAVLPWRARLDRFAARRGGIASVLFAVGLVVTTITTGMTALASNDPDWGTVALLAALVLAYRRRFLGHW